MTINNNVLPGQFQIKEGSLVAHYQILEKLGMGGMGVVYKAHDTQLKRIVALKFMLGSDDGGQALQRFWREMQLTARLEHPHIVKIFHVSQLDKWPFLVMECVDGGPLLKYLEQQQPSLEQKLRLVAKIANALEYAHRQGIIHRDVKPANILVRTGGEPVLMDFGLAKTTHISDMSLTRTGEILGTPEYMAPEQAKGIKRAVDAKSDIYGLGAVLYHLLTGRPPVEGQNLIEKIQKVVESRPPLPSSIVPEIPRAVESICLKSMEKKKEDRYPSAQELADDIQNYLENKDCAATQFYQHRQVRRAMKWAMAGVAALALVVGIWQVTTALVTRLTPAVKIPSQSREVALQVEIEREYATALAKLQLHPEEAYIYLARVEQLLQRLATNKDHKWKEIQNRLPLQLVAAAFGARNYQKAWAMGDKLLGSMTPTPQLLWYTGCAAYHRGLLDKAPDYFHRLERLLNGQHQPDQQNNGSHNGPGKNEQNGAGNAYFLGGAYYYLGLICFQNKQFEQSQKYLEKSLPLAGNQELEFSLSLNLHYVATRLVDLDQRLTPQLQEQLASLLSKIEAGLAHNAAAVPRGLYLESKARYLYRQAAQADADSTTRQTMASEAIRLIEECMQNSMPNAAWHHLRAKANALLANYEAANSDLDVAYDLEPAQFSYFKDKLDLFWNTPSPNMLQKYIRFLAFYMYRSLRVEANLFDREFAQLKQTYQCHVYGIPFATDTFEEYYQKLLESSLGMREVAQTALVSMMPYEKTIQACQDKLAHVPVTAKGLVTELIEKITARQKEERRRQTMMAISQVPSFGKIWNIRQFYPHAVEELREILQTEENAFLKFLAARVLANIPVSEHRQYLWKTYLEKPLDIAGACGVNADDKKRQAIINTLLVLYALQDVSYKHNLLDPMFFVPLEQLFAAPGPRAVFTSQPLQDELIQMALIQILPKEAASSLAILEWLLKFGSDRVKVMAAASPPLSILLSPESGPLLIQSIRHHMFSADPQISAFCLTKLANCLNPISLSFQRMQWQEVVQEHFVAPQVLQPMIANLSQSPPQVQRAIMHYWREIIPLVWNNPGLLQQFRQATRQLWNDADPLIRCQALMTSGELWDRELFVNVTCQPKAAMLDRMVTLIGVLRSWKGGQVQNEYFWLLQQMVQKKMIEDPDWRIQASLIYFLGYQGRGLFEHIFVNALEHPNPHVRAAALAAIGYWPKIAPKLVDRVKIMANKERVSYVRSVALAVMLHISLSAKNGEADKFHEQIKAVRQEAQAFRLTAGWAYGLKWERGLAISIRTMGITQWLPEQIKEHVCNRFLENSRDPQLRQDHLKRLEKSLELIGELVQDTMCQEHAFYLASLYYEQGDLAQATQLSYRMLQSLGYQDNRFALLWTRLMIEQNRAAEAQATLEKMLTLPQPQDTTPDLAILYQHCLHESQIRRALALVYHHRQVPVARIEALLAEQYLLSPQHPRALIVMGEYYFATDHARALQMFQEAARLLPENVEISIWLARIYARQNDFDLTMWALYQASTQSPLLRPQDLQQYPELIPFLHHPKIQKIWEK